MTRPHLRPADRLEVTILVDNFTDLLLLMGSEVVRRPMLAPPNAPLAAHGLRWARGEQLARESPIAADLVIGVPDSATAAGIGYSLASGIPFSEALLKNRYVGRTFIEPEQRLRALGVKLKFNPMTDVISGKRLVVVDDSIVRGTTTPQVVSLLRRTAEQPRCICVSAPRLFVILASLAWTWLPEVSLLLLKIAFPILPSG